MKASDSYIMSNLNRTVLYIGVTSDLVKRIVEHKQGIGAAFTRKYNLKFLIYYEQFSDIIQAIAREK